LALISWLDKRFVGCFRLSRTPLCFADLPVKCYALPGFRHRRTTLRSRCAPKKLLVYAFGRVSYLHDQFGTIAVMLSLTWPFINAIFGTYLLTGSLGLAIILVTLVIRLLLMPLVMPSLKAATKMRELQPKLKKLQEKYGTDKQGLATAQMDLYKTEKVNPLGGCLPQLLQIAVLIVFFSAFNTVTEFSQGKISKQEFNKSLAPQLKVDNGFKFNPYFLGNDLRLTPSKVFSGGKVDQMIIPLILLLGSGGLQYLTSKLMMGKSEPKKEGTEKKGDMDDMASAMRTQSLYIMPVMTVVIGWGFSLGILWYWFVNSVLMWGQQIVVDKWQKK
jgi:YidC/Oxa1 family membrane protein insertase